MCIYFHDALRICNKFEVHDSCYVLKKYKMMPNDEELLTESTAITSELISREYIRERSYTKTTDNLSLPVLDLKLNRITKYRRQVKRVLDIIGASIGMIFLGIFYPFIALGIKLSSKGPVLFKQDRTGKNGRVFVCYKFRTMHISIQKSIPNGEPDITNVGDRRIFTFGSFLRKSNLDELPQLINVLKGDMSLVGPRPLPVEECRYWRKTIPNFELRYAVKPGLTGWSQVTGYRGGTLDITHMFFRLKRDFKYIERYSIALDFEIIFRTIRQMMQRDTKAH